MKGLSSNEAQKRLETNGSNTLIEENKKTWYKVLFRQLGSILVWILAVAAIISFVVNEMLEFYFIAAIIAIITLMGFLQEWKAEKAMQQLKEMTSASVSVYRDEQVQEISSSELVVGDVILLEMGDKIPADAEVLMSVDLRVDEATLTGESNAVRKNEGDEVYSGTTIVYGRAEARITATGMNSELGKIAGHIQVADEKTPLQIKIDALGFKLGIIAVSIALVIFTLGILDGAPLTTILLVALALTIASIPEALPLTLTLTLSLGMRDMAKKKAIIKKMLAVEGLGATTVICTDKTGTLTKNEMTATRMYANNQEYSFTGSGYDVRGELQQEGKEAVVEETVKQLLVSASLCNNAHIQENNNEQPIRGEPTEAALLIAAKKAGIQPEELHKQFLREKELLFTSERKMMSTVHTSSNGLCAHVKGAPEILLDKCTHILINGREEELTNTKREELLAQNKNYAQEALRVLAVAYKPGIQGELSEETVEKELTFIGLIGLIDPPREEVHTAIQECSQAGIRVKMITGDNAQTAQAIAKQIGLSESPVVLSGEEIEALTDEELRRRVHEIDIYARTKPEHKLRIVEALQANGEIVAMTGDGINDAPAIKKANVGIGMGVKGTDVTKESADMILQDDNFSTIVVAVKDGRRIYDNIEKFTTYLISRNFTEVTIIALGAFFLGFEYLPLLALQILFLNVIGQEMPAIALGLDPANKDIMKRPPRDPRQDLLHNRNMFLVVSMAAFMALTGFFVYVLMNAYESTQIARTVLFATLVLMILAHTFNFRSLTHSIRKVGLFGNKWVIAAVLLTIPILLATIYLPSMAAWFNHTPLGGAEWVVALIAASITVLFIEVLKKVANRLYGEAY
ncbi:MAG: cation-translocating P-type ATPase [Candidatus Woesearchaeota archaeon]